jgi:hypothetical protein
MTTLPYSIYEYQKSLFKSAEKEKNPHGTIVPGLE